MKFVSSKTESKKLFFSRRNQVSLKTPFAFHRHELPRPREMKRARPVSTLPIEGLGFRELVRCVLEGMRGVSVLADG